MSPIENVISISSDTNKIPAKHNLDLTVSTYLKCTNGTLIKNFYAKTQVLDTTHRNLLSNTIIYKEFDNFVGGNFQITTQRFVDLVQEIIEIFPNEDGDLFYTPYNKNTKQLAKGKLWDSYNHLKQKIRRNQLEPSSSTSKPVLDNSLKDKIDFLGSNVNDQAKINEYWNETREYRLTWIRTNENISIYEYYETFKCLKGKLGKNLMFSDFENMYPNCSQKILSWPEINLKIEKYCRTKKISAYQDIKCDLRGFLQIVHILASSVYKKNIEAPKKRVKLSKKEVLDSFLHLVTVCSRC